MTPENRYTYVISNRQNSHAIRTRTLIAQQDKDDLILKFCTKQFSQSLFTHEYKTTRIFY